MQSKEDLLRLLNEVKPLIYGKKTVPFALKQLTWHANPKLGGKRYEAFHIKKKIWGRPKHTRAGKRVKSIAKNAGAYTSGCF